MNRSTQPKLAKLSKPPLELVRRQKDLILTQLDSVAPTLMSSSNAKPSRLLRQVKDYCARNHIELEANLSALLPKKETGDAREEESKGIGAAADRDSSSEYSSQGENSDEDSIPSKYSVLPSGAATQIETVGTAADTNVAKLVQQIGDEQVETSISPKERKDNEAWLNEARELAE